MMTDAVGPPGPSGVSTDPPPLVVDDDPRGTALTRGRLAAAGYPTAAESAGDAVLRLVRARMVRLVVSELYIPFTDEACVVAALKQDRSRVAGLRVLVHTRHAAADDDAWALAAGCDAVVHKPAPPAALLREVRRLEGGDAAEPDEVGISTGQAR